MIIILHSQIKMQGKKLEESKKLMGTKRMARVFLEIN